MNYYIRIVILFLFISTNIFGQPKSHIKHYGLADGLPQRSVMDILQDKKGYMWFATWGGLCKFDGSDFTTYKGYNDDSGVGNNNRIDKIKVDHYNNIWTYTAYTKEAHRFDTRKERYTQPFKIGNDNFQTSDILVMLSGKVWLVSDTMGAICVADSTNSYDIYTRENNSLISNNVNLVFEDSRYESWMLTNDGIARLKASGNQSKTEIFFSTTGKDNHSFYSAYESESEIWFGANNGNIVCFNKSTERFDMFHTGAGSAIISIKKIYDNLVIILTSNDGFFICDNNRSDLNKFDKSRLKELPTNEMKSCFIDSRNNVWLELGGFNLAKFDLINNRVKCYQPEISAKGDMLYSPEFSILEDKSGRIWVHPRGGGFSYYDKKNDRLMPFYNDPQSPDWKFSHILHALYIDKQGNIWMSTRSDGLEKITFDDESFSKSDFAVDGKSRNSEIRAVFEDSDENLWIGSKDGTVAVYDHKKQFKGYLSVNGNISPTETPLNIMAYTFMLDSKKNIWIGSKGNGLFLLKKTGREGSYSISNYVNNPSNPYSLSDDRVYAIHQDNDENIWIGTLGGGLNLFDENNVRFINYSNVMDSYPMNTGYEIRSINSRNNVVYVASTLGLIAFTYSKNKENTFSFRIYSKSAGGLRANDIYNVYRSSNNDIYISSQGGGLCMIEEFDSIGFPTRFKSFDTINKLSSDIILSVIEDNNNKLWVVSEGNIFSYDMSSGHIEQYNSVSRIIDPNFFGEAMPLFTGNGEIILGCTHGTLSFFPEKITPDNFKPYMSLSQLRVSGQEYISKGELEYIDRIKLNHHQNNFTIEYAALDFANSRGVLYAYMLEGLDNDWIYNQNQRIVNYTNLSPGTYTFRVKSTNSNGVWTNNERTIDIIVEASFWQTRWAWLLYISVFSVVTFVVLRSIVVFYRMRDRIRLEQEQVELRTRFFTDISHEIRTPLTLIVSPLENIIERDMVLPDAKPQLQLVLKNTNRMLDMVNKILDFKKIQQQKLFVREVELGYMVEDICSNFIAISIADNIALKVNNQIGADKVWVNPDNIETLIFNLVSNAIKHSRRGNCIEVSISQKDKTFDLQVRDEGEGMCKEIQSKLFTRFASFSKDKSKPGTGIGLSIVKEIVDQHHANIRVESNINEGSVFTIQFQPGLSHFLNDNNAEILHSVNDDPEADLRHEEAQDVEGGIISDTQLSILVVEDDTDLRNFIGSVLSPFYKIYEASDGDEGYELALGNMPDFILSDVMMPGISGMELLQKIRSNITTSEVNPES